MDDRATSEMDNQVTRTGQWSDERNERPSEEKWTIEQRKKWRIERREIDDQAMRNNPLLTRNAL